MPIEPDDYLTIVINTTAAPMTQAMEYPSQAAPRGYFEEATSIEMTFGAYYLNSADVEYRPYTSFFINEYDANGLPTNWNLIFLMNLTVQPVQRPITLSSFKFGLRDLVAIPITPYSLIPLHLQVNTS